MSDTVPTTGSQAMRAFFPQSPFIDTLGVRLIEIDEGRAHLRLPFTEANTTVGPMVHGGAISACVDLGIMAAAWGGDTLPENMRGVTVSMSVNFIAPAMNDDLEIHGTRLRRGRKLSHCHVEIRSRASGALVATGAGVYQVG
ncbi:MAG: PaaI family thioesterase [Gordonia sp. (in: high G+C Gram-positive bacteria)]|uniref:PaaI family thioesterase n=1 Tax=Gordonia sp. (in: high G+C Gram-positive bacteria) TaxID=84139 RepID=UPI0039E471B9